ncbi:MAG: UPF0179 family protein [Candidatus Methanomethyliaceae archaeon]|nr:UPF0179 family protein [Candidatus Methanomethyliaceae archaeon]MCX8170338.1 UPF0179 family protein [Candidatus Methanomethyliaceae archaeon]MDW7971013.1 UPF0179 family protein [Nitrososphaerota archaeon]
MRETVTLVGEGMAKRGLKFMAIEAPQICKSCNLFDICMKNVIAGRFYEIIEVRGRKHYCKLYEGKLVVVKVVELPMEIILRKSIAIEGAIIRFSWIECNEMNCILRNLCKPIGLKIGERIKILNVLNDVSEMALCGKEMVRVIVEVAD